MKTVWKHKTKHKGKKFDANYSSYGKRTIWMNATTGTLRKHYTSWKEVKKDFTKVKSK